MSQPFLCPYIIVVLVGATIRYMVTGVPPQYNVNEYIESKNHPLKKVVRALKQRSRKNGKRIKQYRSSDDLPNGVKDLIGTLTHYNSRKRATVRMAKGHQWVMNDICTPNAPILQRHSIIHVVMYSKQLVQGVS